jgi:predicted RNase H-like nuclease (RuvC/YqgF family)
MKDAQGAFSHEKEAKGQNISVGDEETKSNGHRSRVEPTKLVQSMRCLRMEVQSYRADNEKIMRAQEEQNQINTQLLQSLNQLQRHMKNGSGLRHEEEGGFHARRNNYRGFMHSRSASRAQRHHYLPTHSARKYYASEESTSNP